MSKELKRPIREKHKPYQGYEIFERYSKAQDKYIDQLESKLKESDQQNKQQRRNDLINCIKALHGDKEINANHLNWLDNEYLKKNH